MFDCLVLAQQTTGLNDFFIIYFLKITKKG